MFVDDADAKEILKQGGGLPSCTIGNPKINVSANVTVSLLKDKNTIEAIKNIEKNKGNASMIMLGNAVFSDKYFKGAIKLKISDKKACLL